MSPAHEITTIPRCPHFGACGGCQLQDVEYLAQLRGKQLRLQQLLRDSGVALPADISLHPSPPYEYRNRIRLHLSARGGSLRFGYFRSGSTEFLPVSTCSIAAPLLIVATEKLLAAATEDPHCASWCAAAAEVELFANHDLSRLQLTLFCSPRTRATPHSFTQAMSALQQQLPQLAGAEAHALDPRTGPTGRVLASFGAPGLLYRVGADEHWISRGAFFQVNRFLLAELVDAVTTDTNGQPFTGAFAWDLYAGVGLFSQVLARHFQSVTAVESNPVAAADLRRALDKLSREQGRAHRAVAATTLEFLHRAVVDRERPERIVLDPPRAGVGGEACDLLARIAAPTLLYVSCDPTTLASDLAALTSPRGPYTLHQLHLFDLFPQTSHLETLARLEYTSSNP